MTKNSALDPSADSPSRARDSKGLEKHVQERYVKKKKKAKSHMMK